MSRIVVLCLAVLAALPGCVGGGDGGNGPTSPTGGTAQSLQAPWWEIGESWTVTFEQAGRPAKTTTLVNFANNTFGDPAHFWLGTADRSEALDHVFFDSNPFLGRIHWELLSPHEKGMHSTMYAWPLEDGSRWNTALLFGQTDVFVTARREAGGGFEISGSNDDASTVSYDYEPDVRWFKHLEVAYEGATLLRATTTDHGLGAKGTYYFLRGRDYIDAKGGTTGAQESFTVKDEGATSMAFLLNIQTSGPSSIEFIDPSGGVFHRETLPLGGAADKIVEVPKAPPPGDWKIRYVGTVTGSILVRGVIEYKATL